MECWHHIFKQLFLRGWDTSYGGPAVNLEVWFPFPRLVGGCFAVKFMRAG
jgi:hypothetical protein